MDPAFPWKVEPRSWGFAAEPAAVFLCVFAPQAVQEETPAPVILLGACCTMKVETDYPVINAHRNRGGILRFDKKIP